MAAKAVHPHMVARGGGAIVNFTSISAKVAQTGRWLYPVGKAALVQLTRNMAMDLAARQHPRQLRLAGLDVVEGDGRAERRRSREDRSRRGAVPPARPCRRSRGSRGVVVFLCSDDASFVTGADWAVDGGYSAMGPEQAEPAIPKLTEWRHMSRILIVGAGQAGPPARVSGSCRTARGHRRLESDARGHPRRAGDVEPVHVRRGAQHERDLGLNDWERRVPADRRHLARGAGAGRERQGDRLGLAARRATRSRSTSA